MLFRSISAAWVAFAKRGNPGTVASVRWEPVTTDGYAFVEFGVEGPQLRRDFVRPRLDFISGLSGRSK